jgi:X-X-X-Leu-X-X-Gly heptad repeat protein
MSDTKESRRPDGGELYSIADIAEALGVSRQAVYKRLRNDAAMKTKVDKHCIQVDNHRRYTVEALNLLKAAICADSCKPVDTENVNQLTENVNQLADLVNQLTTKVNQLTEAGETAEEAHRTEAEQLRASHAAQLAAIRQKHAEQLEQLRGDLKEATAERDALRILLDNTRAECERLREDCRQQLEAIRAEREQLRADLLGERQHSRETAEKLAQLADQAQRLQLAAMQPPAMLEDAEAQKKRPPLWARLFHKQ